MDARDTDLTEADDAMIQNFLDDLIVSARQDVDVTQVDATSSQHDAKYTPQTLHEGLRAANSLLLASHLPTLPTLKDSIRPLHFSQQQNNNASDVFPLDIAQQRIVEADANENSNETSAHSVAQHHDNSSNIRSVLADALTMLVRVCRANSANMKLRQKAEASASQLQSDLQTARKSNAALRTRLEVAKDATAAAKRKSDVITQQRDNAARKHNTETTELRARLQTALNREKSLAQEVQRRDKDAALLKQRVHALISSSRGTPILPRITPATVISSPVKRKAARARAAKLNGEESDSRDEVKETAEMAERARITVAEEENAVFRDLLRAVQEELDDLLLISYDQNKERSDSGENRHAVDSDAEEAGIERESSEEKENDDVNREVEESRNEKGSGGELDRGTSWESVLSAHDVVPAPTEEQMRLPFEMIREEFEESLERKFVLVRSALEQNSVNDKQ